jgi:predicted GNAT family acetyltransferase
MPDRPGMRVHVGDATHRELRGQAVAHLVVRPVENNLPLTILDAAGGDTLVALVSAGANPVGVAVRSSDGRLVLSTMPPVAAITLAHAMAARQQALPGAFGPAEPTAAFAATWEGVLGQAATLTMRQQIFRLDAVDPPRGVSGRLRPASRDDLDVVVRWATAFDEETGVGDTDVRTLAARRVAGGMLWLWEVSRTPVAMATRGQVVAGVARIGHVYTPPECRRRGYAGALVAALSADALRAAARSCTLCTDEANATSNRIYQSIGYRPVGSALLYRFVPRPPA